MSKERRKIDLQRQGKKHPVIGSVFVLVLGGLVGKAVDVAVKPLQSVGNETAKDLLTFSIIAAAALLFVLIYVWLMFGHVVLRDSEKIRHEDERAAGPKESFSRFENIEQAIREKRLRYGFVPFFPTCVNERDTTMTAKGPGIDLLEKIFMAKLPDPSRRRTWSELFEDLEGKDPNHAIHICATPLYDVRERREKVEFSAPLFYADVGLFVRIGNDRIPSALQENAGNNTFQQVLDALTESVQRDLKILAVRDELQEKMFKRHLPYANPRLIDGQFDIATAIQHLTNNPGSFDYTDLLFCERVQVADNGNEKVINLLKPGQLLFPVCFAMRKGEDTLRKYVNLRLLSIDGSELPDRIGSEASVDPDAFSGVMQVLEAAAAATMKIPSDFRRFYRRHYRLDVPKADNVVPFKDALEGGQGRA